MTTNTDMSKREAPNYTPEMEQALINAAPMDYEKSKQFAELWDKSPQSIVAKCGHLKIAYVKQQKPKKKPVAETKAELVAMIEGELDRNCEGLEKATRSAILAVLNGVQHLVHSLNELDQVTES